MENKLLFQIALTLLPDVGNITAKKLIAYCGNTEAIFQESAKNLLKIPNISRKAINSILTNTVMKEAEEELNFIIKNNIKTLFFLDKDYPNRLKHCVDSPLLLYLKGNTDLNTTKILSVVGTRQPTQHGEKICEDIIAQFSNTDTIIVSGLAYGIDAISHKAALKNNLKTVGVLGTGIDKIYPSQNANLAQLMIEQGGTLLTEFRKATKPERQNFPQRNRIVAGMSDATLIIESKDKGGSLITAQLAFDYNRDVFAVPGRPSDTLSIGCNNLIKRNIAQIINSADDIKKELNWNEEENTKNIQKKIFVELNKEEELLTNLISKKEEISIDEISNNSGLSISKTANILLELEFKGIVKLLPGKRYKMI